MMYKCIKNRIFSIILLASFIVLLFSVFTFMTSSKSVFASDELSESESFILLRAASPVKDFTMLINASNWLEEQNLPYIIEVIPVFYNTEHDQMKRFVYLIGQLQLNGASIVLSMLEGWQPPPHSFDQTIIYDNTQDRDAAYEYMLTALSTYINYDIYPVAISSSPELYLSEDYAHIVKPYSLFIQSKLPYDTFTNKVDIKPISITENNTDYIPSVFYPEEFAKEDLPIDVMLIKLYEKISKTPAAICFDISNNEEVEKMKDTLLFLLKKGISFRSLREVTSSVNIENISIQNSNGMLFLNNERVVLKEPTLLIKPEDPSNNGHKKYDENSIVGRIDKIVTYIIFIISVFIVLLLLAYFGNKILDRRKFME